MSDNYQNFFYLFNDKNEVNFETAGVDAIYPYDVGLGMLAWGGIIAGGKVAFNAVGGDTKDFPTYQTSTKRTDEVIIGETEAKNIQATKTNDPGNSPWRTHIFKITKQENGGGNSYAFKEKTGNEKSSDEHYKFNIKGAGKKPKASLLLRAVHGGDYYRFGAELPKKNQLNGGADVVWEGDNSFMFYQRLLYTTKEGFSYAPKDGKDAIWNTGKGLAAAFKDFFEASSGNVTGGKQGFFTPFSSIDIATKIGIPYDYQTILFEDINQKSAGIKTKQPSYDKIYNYFDPQYEPSAVELIEEGVIDERALPSIYDFLYLSSQASIRPLIKLSSISLEETNLGGINNYLDSFASAYSEYLDANVPGETAESFVEMDFFAGKWVADYNVSLKDLGWVNPAAPAVDPTKKQLLYQGLDMLAGDEIGIEEKKQNNNPLWVNQLKTGTYFSQKSIDIFNQTVDKDAIFPFLMKINIPSETPGPIAKILREHDLLDALNTYAASNTVPNQNDISTYNDFYGGVLNGVDSTSFNILNGLKLPGFKILFKDRPKPKITIESIFELAKKWIPEPAETSAPPGTGLGGPGVAGGVDATANLGDTEDVGQDIAAANEMAIFKSWQRRKIDDYAKTHNLNSTHRIIIKIHPWGGNYGPAPGQKTSTGIELAAPRLEIWAYCNEGVKGCINGIHGGASQTWTWTSNQYQVEKWSHGAVTEGDWKAYTFEKTEYASIYEVTDTDLTPKSIFHEKIYANDLYMDNLLGNHLPNVLVYEEDGAGNLTQKSSIQALLEKLKLISFKKKMKKLLTEGKLLRTPDDIHGGKLAHQETLMYEIAKYGVTDTGDYYIQSFFLPVAEQEKLSYYDTQVLPYREYFYKIFAHKAILGTEYKVVEPAGDTSLQWSEFTPLVATQKKQWFGVLKYQAEPFIQVVRVPYYNTEAVNLKVDKLNYSRIEDKPPLPPQVNIVPFRNINNKLLFLMNNSLGQIEQYPKVVFDKEWVLFDQVALAQDRAPGDPLIFKSDDSMGTFHIHRTDKMHSSYQKFGRDSTLKTTTLENFGTYGRSETSFIDKITPNKDYYYFFRFEDLHMKMSNPTVVYKVRMISEKGSMPYLDIETLDMAEIQKREYNEKFSAVKNMKKYLLIQPCEAQKQVITPTLSDGTENIDGSFSELTVQLGNPDGSAVFGKNFKLRLTSKQTGRKIDINLSVKPPENIING